MAWVYYWSCMFFWIGGWGLGQDVIIDADGLVLDGALLFRGLQLVSNLGLSAHELEELCCCACWLLIVFSDSCSIAEDWCERCRLYRCLWCGFVLVDLDAAMSCGFVLLGRLTGLGWSSGGLLPWAGVVLFLVAMQQGVSRNHLHELQLPWVLDGWEIGV